VSPDDPLVGASVLESLVVIGVEESIVVVGSLVTPPVVSIAVVVEPVLAEPVASVVVEAGESSPQATTAGPHANARRNKSGRFISRTPGLPIHGHNAGAINRPTRSVDYIRAGGPLAGICVAMVTLPARS
jgi:hypothetical protein